MAGRYRENWFIKVGREIQGEMGYEVWQGDTGRDGLKGWQGDTGRDGL